MKAQQLNFVKELDLVIVSVITYNEPETELLKRDKNRATYHR